MPYSLRSMALSARAFAKHKASCGVPGVPLIVHPWKFSWNQQITQLKGNSSRYRLVTGGGKPPKFRNRKVHNWEIVYICAPKIYCLCKVVRMVNYKSNTIPYISSTFVFSYWLKDSAPGFSNRNQAAAVLFCALSPSIETYPQQF